MILKLVVFCFLIGLPTVLLLPERNPKQVEEILKARLIHEYERDGDGEDEAVDDYVEEVPKSRKKSKPNRSNRRKKTLVYFDDDEKPKDDVEKPKDDVEKPKDDVEKPKDEVEKPKKDDNSLEGEEAAAMKVLQDTKRPFAESTRVTNLEGDQVRVMNVQKVVVTDMQSNIMLMNETFYEGTTVLNSTCYIYHVTRLAQCAPGAGGADGAGGSDGADGGGEGTGGTDGADQPPDSTATRANKKKIRVGGRSLRKLMKESKRADENVGADVTTTTTDDLTTPS